MAICSVGLCFGLYHNETCCATRCKKWNYYTKNRIHYDTDRQGDIPDDAPSDNANLCSFLAEGNQPLEIDVKASPAEWTVEMGASWVKAERTDDRTLTVTVDDNDTGAERSAVLQ